MSELEVDLYTIANLNMQSCSVRHGKGSEQKPEPLRLKSTPGFNIQPITASEATLNLQFKIW